MLAFNPVAITLWAICCAIVLLNGVAAGFVKPGSISSPRLRSHNWVAQSSNTLTELLNDDEVEEDDDEKSQRHLRFAGVGRLYAQSAPPDVDNNMEPHLQILERLHKSTVAVIGIGGVGSWSAEALCRSGVGNLILIDLDDICISNTNRQLHATSTSVGQMKIDEMRRRLLQINPQCSVTNIHEFVSEGNVHELLDSLLPDLDIVLDAIDSREAKTALIAACVEKKIPIVTVGGAAGKMDASKIHFEDLNRVNGDTLLSLCRKNLRKFHGFSQGAKWADRKGKLPKKWRIPAVYSTEVTKELPKDSGTVGGLRRCDGALGTACFVTGTFGFVAAGQVVDMLAKNKPFKPRRS